MKIVLGNINIRPEPKDFQKEAAYTARYRSGNHLIADHLVNKKHHISRRFEIMSVAVQVSLC